MSCKPLSERDKMEKDYVYVEVDPSRLRRYCMDTTGREKIPTTRRPITKANVSLHAKPPAPGPKVRSGRRTPPRTPPPAVTLEQPRVHSIRTNNDYGPTPHVNPHVERIDPISANTAICRQPESLKDPSSEGADACTESIICPNCERCKCQSCATPRELPRKWVCGDKEVSLQCAVEYCTCIEVVQFLFDRFDIIDKDYETPLSDDPCACCEEPHCCKRWTCMGLLSLCLPCLCFYPCLKCGLSLCTKCYDRVTRRSCTCRAKNVPGSKKLLIEHENSSST